ncbi:MAG TPA: ABC transporter ATP-binding protein [Ilumatobacteraceae bacterium]
MLCVVQPDASTNDRTRRGGAVSLVALGKQFGSQPVLRGIDLEIPSGEFFSLLGPSGCGKSTTLRLIGGFERPDGGQVLIDGVDMAGTPPERRPVNTVFQSYALFPHFDVAENVAFGLRFAPRVDKRERRRRVGEVLELVRLSELARRRPHQLSGGQQQRVALARALVLRPSVLLLDEPLGALDAKLRKTLQHELTALHREVGITFVYVTHDQEEALTMSDRLAVMREGGIEQVGRPRDVYEVPANAYVAEFLGIANLIDAEHLGGGRLRIDGVDLMARTCEVPAGRCRVVVRPERVRLLSDGGAGGLPARVERIVYIGAVTQLHVHALGAPMQLLVANDGSPLPGAVGDEIRIELPPDALRVLEDRDADVRPTGP